MSTEYTVRDEIVRTHHETKDEAWTAAREWLAGTDHDSWTFPVEVTILADGEEIGWVSIHEDGRVEETRP